jgi:KUP system potassium uptake protein
MKNYYELYSAIKKKYAFLKRVLWIDSSSVKIEKFPMVLHIPENMGLTR